MESPVPPPAPKNKKPVNWPIAVNLGLLVLNFLFTRSIASVLISLVVLAVVNGIAALIMGFSNNMRWATAFVLSALLVLLIGLGICGLMLQNFKSGGFN